MSRFEKFLSIYQILGGVGGLIIGLVWLRANPDYTALISVFLLMSVASCIAGVLVWLKRRAAFPFSLAVQAVQVPAFAVASIAYTLGLGLVFVLGPEFGLSSDGTISFGFPLDFQVGGVFALSFGDQFASTLLRVNVVPLVLVAAVVRHYKRQVPVAAYAT
ncbi:hypothetical protein [Agrilutibacter solisilvae]|uniref:Uncharacterized protein n=1 Tax=Agrilutibacter solisilvae TaxID=2763317 RepID=A0A975ASV7_9GAMM|nr:hypothetical protein [Lysobacter solisilvae]QSX79369.1 hypothetical protein I8J32_005775 [Lysobacter solisilvae]